MNCRSVSPAEFMRAAYSGAMGSPVKIVGPQEHIRSVYAAALRSGEPVPKPADDSEPVVLPEEPSQCH